VFLIVGVLVIRHPLERVLQGLQCPSTRKACWSTVELVFDLDAFFAAAASLAHLQHGTIASLGTAEEEGYGALERGGVVLHSV